MKQGLFLLVFLPALALGLHDPTAPPGKNVVLPANTATVQKIQLQLKMVVHSKKVRKALIDDKLVTEGDVVEGYRVLQIANNEVVLRAVAGKAIKRLEIAPQLLK